MDAFCLDTVFADHIFHIKKMTPKPQINSNLPIPFTGAFKSKSFQTKLGSHTNLSAGHLSHFHSYSPEGLIDI